MSVSHYTSNNENISEVVAENTDGESRVLKNLIIASGCPVLQSLLELKRKGWDAGERLDTHFDKQRKRAATSSSKGDERFWIRTMRNSLEEMDITLGLIPRLKPFRFLDLGCAPGGYSTYILEKCINSTGVGITLPAEEGGHIFSMSEKYLPDRYQVHHADLTTYDVTTPQCLEGCPSLPFTPSSFDFVILDCSALWNRHYDWSTAWVLLVSQLLVAFRAVKAGGTLFVRLDKPDSEFTARFLYLLDSVSKKIDTIKPNGIHGNRGTLYAVARGIIFGEQLDIFIHALQNLRMQYEPTGQPSDNQDIGDREGLCQSALDSIAPLEVIKTVWLPRLIELGMPVWKVQKEHLGLFLLKKKIYLG